MNLPTLPVETGDPINARILAVSEDKIQGFQRDPLGEIARLSGVSREVCEGAIEREQVAPQDQKVELGGAHRP